MGGRQIPNPCADHEQKHQQVERLVELVQSGNNHLSAPRKGCAGPTCIGCLTGAGESDHQVETAKRRPLNTDPGGQSRMCIRGWWLFA